MEPREAGPSPPPSRLVARWRTVVVTLLRVGRRRLHGVVEELDRHREDDRRVLLGRDGTQRLEITQLESQRRLADDVRRLLQRPRSLLLAFRRYHLRQINY